MADSYVQLANDGAGKKVDTRTESTNLEHRQVFVIGDPSANTGVAPVDGTKGLAVDLTATGSNTNALKVDGSAVTQPVSAVSLPLPTGAATSANQTTGNTSLASIDTKTPALGQAVAGSSVPVVLPASQITTLTPPTTITANAGTNLNTSALALESGGNLATLAGGVTGSKYQVTQNAAALGSATLQSAATATGAGTAFTVSGYSAVIFTVTGTFVGTITFQGSEDGTNFSNISAVQLGTNTISTTATAAGVYEAACSGLTSVRANITGYTSGSINVTAHASPVAYNGKVINVGNLASLAQDATLTGGTQKAQLTDGTNVANVLKSDGTAAGQNAQIVAGGYLEKTFSVTAAGATTAIDVSNYKSISLQIISQYTTSTVNFQGSNDGTNWTPVPMTALTAGNLPTNSIATTGIVWGAVTFRYFRLNITGAYTSGTCAGIIEFYSNPIYTNAGAYVSQMGTWTMTQSGTWTLGTTATSNSLSEYHLVSAATTNSNNVKASAAQLYGWTLTNASAAMKFVKLYNKATAPTVGTDTPVRTIGIAPTTSISYHSVVGIPFATGLGIGITGAVADADTTAVASADVVVDLDYR